MNNLALQKSVEFADQQSIDVFKIGEVFAKSGYFTDAKDASQAIVKILAGREIGIGAMASMTGFHIVQGKPTLSANLIASIIKNRNSGYNYRVRELNDAVCEIEFFEQSESIGKSRFTFDEAKNAGLTNKDVWKKHPKNMLFARAISNGAKWFCPDVFNGATVYTPEELGANVNADGELLPETATIHQLPTKKQLAENASADADPLNKKLAELCSSLNAANDSIVWKSKTLTEYANDLFGSEYESFKSLSGEEKESLIEDLQQRFDEILALQSENIIDVETEEI